MWINVAWLTELYRFSISLWRFVKAAIRARGRVESIPEDDVASASKISPGTVETGH